MDYPLLYRYVTTNNFALIALFGAGMLCLSLLFGGHDDHDSDHDGDHDGDHDHDGAGGNMSVLSFKVLWIFMVGFGAGGYFAANADSGVASACWSGLGVGTGFGLIGYSLMNALFKRQGNSIIGAHSLLGKPAIVTITIYPGKIGEVCCSAAGVRSEYCQARSLSEVFIPISAKVVITDVTGGILLVERLESGK